MVARWFGKKLPAWPGERTGRPPRVRPLRRWCFGELPVGADVRVLRDRRGGASHPQGFPGSVFRDEQPGISGHFLDCASAGLRSPAAHARK